MGYCIHCGARLGAGEGPCLQCGATTQHAGAKPLAAAPPPTAQREGEPSRPLRRRGRLVAAIAAGSTLVATLVAGGLVAAGVLSSNDAATSGRGSRGPLPPIPTQDGAHFADKTRLKQLGKLPGSVLVVAGGETGSADDPAHAVLVSNASVAVVCGQIRRQWLPKLKDQRYGSETDRSDSLSGYLRGGDECAFGGKGNANGKKFNADIFARRLSSGDPRVVLAAQSSQQKLDSLARVGAPAFHGSYTEFQISTDAPFFDVAREKRRAAARQRRIRDAAGRMRTDTGAAPSNGESEEPTSFHTGTSPGQTVAAAYCRLEGERSNSGVYCWTPNDGYTVRLDSSGARRVRGDEVANRGVTPGSYGELPLGSSRSRSGYICTSQDSGLTCTGPHGAGWSLPRYRGLARLF